MEETAAETYNRVEKLADVFSASRRPSDGKSRRIGAFRKLFGSAVVERRLFGKSDFSSIFRQTSAEVDRKAGRFGFAERERGVRSLGRVR